MHRRHCQVVKSVARCVRALSFGNGKTNAHSVAFAAAAIDHGKDGKLIVQWKLLLLAGASCLGCTHVRQTDSIRPNVTWLGMLDTSWL